jgi:hypothetical protein
MVRKVSEENFDAVRLVLLRSSGVGAMIESQEFQPASALNESAHSYELRRGWISILVPDLRALIAFLHEHGLHPASEVFWVKLPQSRACEAVFYEDPDGNDLEFLQIVS